MGVFKVRRIVFVQLEWCWPTPFFLTLAFKRYSTSTSNHDVGASNVLIFIGNPDVDSLSVVSDANPVLIESNAAIKLYYIKSFRYVLIRLILSAQQIRAVKRLDCLIA